MKKFVFTLFLLCFSWHVPAQKRINDQEIIKYVEVPREQVLMTIVNQPHCPLKIEDASFLVRIDKDEIVQRYKVRNVSSKPIATFTVTSWSMSGSGGTLPVALADPNRFMKPGEVIDSMNQHPAYEVVPLTKQLREQMKINRFLSPESKMSGVFFLMIDQVNFVDGSVYREKTIADSLQGFLSNHYDNCDK
jgi:hypothetical protein